MMKDVIRRLGTIMTRRQKHKLVLLAFMMLVGAALETVGTSLILPLVEVAMDPDEVLENRILFRIYTALGMESPRHFIMVLCFLLCGVYIAKNLYLYVMYNTQYRFVYDGQYDTSRRIFADYIGRPYEYYLNASTGKVMRNIQGDVSGTYSLLLALLRLATESVISLFLFVLSFVTNPWMTGIMALFIGGVLLLNRKLFGPVLHHYGLEVQQNNAQTIKWLLQALTGIKDTKVLHKERYFSKQYEHHSGVLNAIQIRQATLSNIPSLSIETVMMVGILAAVGVLIRQGTGVSSMIGQVAVLCMVGIRILPSANRIANAFNDISYYEPSLAAVEQVLARTEAEKERPKADTSKEVTRVPFQRQIRFEHLSYRYPGTDTDILADADLMIPKGASVGLIGPSGAGKSTTVDVLLGLLVPRAGKVTVDGADIRDNLPGWYDRIGYVPQMIYMLDDTIRANVAYGIAPEKIDDEKVWRALAQARIDGFVRDLPHGLDTGIGERGVRISGGQRQRLGIARALYHNPDVLIFDEATSALDSHTENGIMEAIDDFKGRKTIVIVAHRLTTIRSCDAVYRVEGGGFHPVSSKELAVLLEKATAEEEKERQAKKAKEEGTTA